MLHTAIESFTDSSLVDRPRSSQGLPEVVALSTRNGIVKEFVAVDLLAFPTEISGRSGQLSKAVFSSETRSSKFCSGLSRNNDSNMVCEGYRADALVKQFIGRDCHKLIQISVFPTALASN